MKFVQLGCLCAARITKHELTIEGVAVMVRGGLFLTLGLSLSI